MPRSALVLSLVGGLVGLLFAVVLYLRFESPDGASSQLRGYQILSDSVVRVEIAVSRDPGTEVFCVLRARNRAGAEVGRLSFDVPPSQVRASIVRREVATSGRPVSGELVGCARGRAKPAP